MDFWDKISSTAIAERNRLDVEIHISKQRITMLRSEIDKLSQTIDTAKAERRVINSQVALLEKALAVSGKDPAQLDSFVSAAELLVLPKTS